MRLYSKTMKLKSFKQGFSTFLFVVACAVSGQSLAVEPIVGTDLAKTASSTVKRDPFWPVGYTPEWAKDAGKSSQEPVAAGNGNGDWNIAMKQVVIQGVSSSADNDSYAVINGEIKTVGDTVSVKYGSSTYTWAVESITAPSAVQLRRVSVK